MIVRQFRRCDGERVEAVFISTFRDNTVDFLDMFALRHQKNPCSRWTRVKSSVVGSGLEASVSIGRHVRVIGPVSAVRQDWRINYLFGASAPSGSAQPPPSTVWTVNAEEPPCTSETMPKTRGGVVSSDTMLR